MKKEIFFLPPLHLTILMSETDRSIRARRRELHRESQDAAAGEEGELTIKRSSSLSESMSSMWKQLEGDRANVLLLLFLYILQGIPLGLSGSVSFIISSKHVSYHNQAQFSLVFWPFSLKLFWAPLIDHMYVKWFGRRKSWLVPTQYLIGVFMIFLSQHATTLLYPEDGATVDITFLTAIFFMLNFLASVQDIAVDGWALTMLSERNVALAATCNSVGQTFGYFIGNVIFLVLQSADVSNKYLRPMFGLATQTDGIVSFESYMLFWGVVFLLCTSLVWWFKHETDDGHESEQSIMEAYSCLYKIIKLPSVQTLTFILLTAKVCFSASENVGAFKLIEHGVTKETIAFIGSLMVPIQLIMPIVISRLIVGKKPLNVFMWNYIPRMVIGVVFAVVVIQSENFKTASGDFPFSFFALIFLIYAVHQVFLYSMFVSSMAFSNKISDPAVGGTYMTLLNTMSNLGGVWPSTLFLEMVDHLTWKNCQGGSADGDVCVKAEAESKCKAGGGVCTLYVDGFSIEMVASVFIAALWFWKMRHVVYNLSNLPSSAWRIQKQGRYRTVVNDEEEEDAML